MKKEYRIKRSEDFQTIIKKRQSVSSSRFVVYYMRNDDYLRVGISVSKKLGNAVVRNKSKRQIRMMAQEVFDKKEKMDYIIITRKNFLVSSYVENIKELKYLRGKIYKRMEK